MATLNANPIVYSASTNNVADRDEYVLLFIRYPFTVIQYVLLCVLSELDLDNFADDQREAIDQQEIFGMFFWFFLSPVQCVLIVIHVCVDASDLLQNINDPEHPLTLEQLKVTQIDLIEVTFLRFACLFIMLILLSCFVRSTMPSRL